MDPFTTLSAIAVPIDQANVDTDQIIPARYLGKPREQQVEGFFHDMRLDPNGRPREGVTLNNPAYKGAQIIVGNQNFACGSSRENAVTVMVDHGYRAFIAPSFGDIFFNNCFQNGCLPIRLPAERVARLRVILHELPGAKISIDLAGQTVKGPDGQTDSFEIDSFRKEMLLKGTDSITFTLGYEKDIARFETAQRQDVPWL
ncbi:3-isopropylmalate/(R)-2-methylmalate dehydratase small subunit [Enhydrobacter aerosaccus]|uniref:3-isopropylmalate dehydratase n=1 Tax=Enhydrobacter aerosaccus TaxID=225324 RepID=A0A1T4T2T2_9HYPH|nr:3-isopropylmalate dehydratase small subunit [Enhydrobacter aerosaccus]SKA34814.1 3-isopropylmalate/(R)-2-methylmalate dehydratase small subunit [Enhydrobacter aerosaccus]